MDVKSQFRSMSKYVLIAIVASVVAALMLLALLFGGPAPDTSPVPKPRPEVRSGAKDLSQQEAACLEKGGKLVETSEMTVCVTK